MKKYLGVKVVKAEPMTSYGWDCRGNGSLPFDEWSKTKKNIDGYLVVYEDGYSSWSPKDVFDKAYRVLDEEEFGGILHVDIRTGQWDFCKNFTIEDESIIADNLTFGDALEILKMGGKVARKGWNGKGMFIFMRPADELNIEFVIDKVKSLPQSVKEYYLQDIINETGERIPVDENDTVKFTAYICMKAADGTIVNGWLASQTDMLASDWQVV